MLVKNLNDVQSWLPIGPGNDFDRLLPHIASAETKYLIPLIGEAFYHKLEEFIHSEYPEDPDETQKKMKKLSGIIQASMVHLSYFIGFDFLNVSVSDLGFSRSESENSKTLYKYQEDNLRKFFQDTGLNYLDRMLSFLDAEFSTFATYANSSYYTKYKKSFLPTVEIVENIPFKIHNSRLILMAMLPYIAHIEQSKIQKLLGEDLYNTIKTEMSTNPVPGRTAKILPFIRKPLAYLAAALLMEETGANLSDKGLLFIKLNSTYPDNQLTSPADAINLSRMIERYNDIGNNALADLQRHLKNNREDFPEFDTEQSVQYRRNNANKKTFWA